MLAYAMMLCSTRYPGSLCDAMCAARRRGTHAEDHSRKYLRRLSRSEQARTGVVKKSSLESNQSKY